jgi:hypothetical protein
MAYTSAELVTNAWYLTGAVSRDLQTVSGTQFEIGMNALNELLAIQTANLGMIAYFQEYNFTGVPGQEKYTIPNLIQTETLTYVIPEASLSDNLPRFPMTWKSRQDYFGTPRANGVSSLPYIYTMERELDGSAIYMYFFPAGEYVFTLWGKFSLAQTVPNQDLSLVFDPFYLKYMRYAVAMYCCEEYNIIPPPSIKERLMEYEAYIRNTSPTDFTQKIQCPFNGGYSPNYAYANASGGLVPSSWGY